jgi:hypothetical protein
MTQQYGVLSEENSAAMLVGTVCDSAPGGMTAAPSDLSSIVPPT